MTTITRQIQTWMHPITVEIDATVVCGGTPATRHHDGDVAEVDIDEVRVDGVLVEGPPRSALIALMGREEIEIAVLQMEQEDRQIDAAESQWLQPEYDWR